MAAVEAADVLQNTAIDTRSQFGADSAAGCGRHQGTDHRARDEAQGRPRRTAAERSTKGPQLGTEFGSGQDAGQGAGCTTQGSSECPQGSAKPSGEIPGLHTPAAAKRASGTVCGLL